MRLQLRQGKAGRKPGLLLCGVALLASAPAFALTPYFEFDGLARADPVPIAAYAGDWDAGLRRGSGDGLAHLRLESGVKEGAWSASYVQRVDYEVVASEGAAALYHRVKNHEAFAPGERFDLALSIWHLDSRGVRLARRWALDPALEVELAVSALEGRRLTDGALTGAATAVASGDYDFQAAVDYRYDRDVLFGRSVEAPRGQGYSLDWSAAGRWRNLDWRAQVRDAFGRMYWEAAPDTVATANSSNKHYGADGYVSYSPVLSGREGYERYAQRLHARGLFEAYLHPAGEWRAGLRGRTSSVRDELSLVWGYVPAGGSFEVEALPAQKAWGVTLGWHELRLQWTSDRLNPQQARYLAMGIQLACTFD